eukprot:gnl/TRDRNA2_/TRDRNA2_143563_c0_seq1.p1 gnl/TRDRNA2_/TRDRNA2_143563_c0~~gnl/TRDRNA2_/TRDRNA2_143563_c0_seq1.p1  ORF type:complete len:355 (+),score=29.30 gnl/TRDRNA2_/TRDRNA2_143563_c0_seq1:156-1067(+)
MSASPAIRIKSDSGCLPKTGITHSVVRLVERTLMVQVVAALTGELVYESAWHTRPTVERLRCSLEKKAIDVSYTDFVVEGLVRSAGPLPFGSEDVLTVQLVQRPPPSPPPPRQRLPSQTFCSSRGDFQGDGCISGDSMVMVLEGCKEVPRAMDAVHVGDLVLSGAEGTQEGIRRVTRIWPCLAHGGTASMVELSAGCRLTANHPVLHQGRWQRAGSLGKTSTQPMDLVYGLELEGHVDTVLVGGVVCAAIGIYCGQEFGWNIYTRKTVPCDVVACTKCSVAVDPGIDFSNVTENDLQERYQPY